MCDVNCRIQEDWVAGEYERALRQRLVSYDASLKGKSDWLFNPRVREDAVISGVSFGEFLYKIARIDPLVINAADFSSIESINNSLSFTNYVGQFDGYSSGAREGVLNRLQGYVAEQAVAMELSDQGYDVQFPESASQPGFDLLVDGQPMQVKCLVDASGVYEHFDKYPDIPVLLNADLAETLGDMENVYPCPGITSDAMQEITRESFDSARSLTDFHVPIITLGVSTCTNAYLWMKGTTDGQHALVNVATDVVGRAVVANAGQWIGALGYLFTPAGGVVGQAFGAAIGAWAGGGISGHFRKKLARGEYAAVSMAFSRLARACASAQAEAIQGILDRMDVLKSKISDVCPNQIVQKSLLQEFENELNYREDWRLRFSSAAKRADEMEPGKMVELFLNSQVEHPVHMAKIKSEVANFTVALSMFDDKCRKYNVRGISR